MNAVPHVVIAAVVILVVLGIPFGLYALLTRVQRRVTREIRSAARQQGWSYRRRRWIGDPTAFRIEGRAASGLMWITTSEPAGGYDQGWTVRLGVRFPALGGKEDFALDPREPRTPIAAASASAISKSMDSRIAAFSQVLADEMEFHREGGELLSGVPAFDATYRILGLPSQLRASPVTPALAARMLNWPGEAVQPHSMLSWRDPFGFHFQARLPGPPNWAAVYQVVSIAEELASLMPPPISSPASTLADRVAARFSRST